MPTYRYLCDKERGGCGQPWNEHKAMHDRKNVMCPYCSAEGHVKNHPVYKDGEVVEWVSTIVQIWEQMPGVISDIDHQDGRTGDRIEMPCLPPEADGSVTTVGSRREMNDKIKRAEEALFVKTDGEHTVVRPVKNEETGKITFEEITTKTEGMEVKLRHIESNEGPANQPRSAFGKDESLEATEQKLAERLK